MTDLTFPGAEKAVRGAAVAGIIYLIGIIPAAGGFGDVTLLGWLGLVLAVLGVGGTVYATTNTTPASSDPIPGGSAPAE